MTHRMLRVSGELEKHKEVVVQPERYSRSACTFHSCPSLSCGPAPVGLQVEGIAAVPKHIPFPCQLNDKYYRMPTILVGFEKQVGSPGSLAQIMGGVHGCMAK